MPWHGDDDRLPADASGRPIDPPPNDHNEINMCETGRMMSYFETGRMISYFKKPKAWCSPRFIETEPRPRGCTLEYFRFSGYTALWAWHTGYSLDAIKAAGYSVQEAKAAGITLLGELMHFVEFDRAFSIAEDELRDALKELEADAFELWGAAALKCQIVRARHHPHFKEFIVTRSKFRGMLRAKGNTPAKFRALRRDGLLPQLLAIAEPDASRVLSTPPCYQKRRPQRSNLASRASDPPKEIKNMTSSNEEHQILRARQEKQDRIERHNEIECQIREQPKAEEKKRRDRAVAVREEKTRQGDKPYTETYAQNGKHLVKRERTRDEQRQHDIHVDPVEKALRSLEFDDKQVNEHKDRVERVAQLKKEANRKLEKELSAAHEATVHVVPPRARFLDEMSKEANKRMNK